MPTGTATLPMNRITPRSKWQDSGMERQRSVRIECQPFLGPFVGLPVALAGGVLMGGPGYSGPFGQDVAISIVGADPGDFAVDLFQTQPPDVCVIDLPEVDSGRWSYLMVEEKGLPGYGRAAAVSTPGRGYPFPADILVTLRVQLGLPTSELKETHTEPATAVVALGEGVAEFVAGRNLGAGLGWLQTQLPHYFPCAAFDLNLSRGDEPDDLSLSLKVYTDDPPDQFRAKAQALCETMHLAGHHEFYLQLGMFQRRGRPDGQPGIPWCRATPER